MTKIHDFMAAPATLSATGATMIWEKPDFHKSISGYRLYQEGQLLAERAVTKTHFTVTKLQPETSYTFTVVAVAKDGSELAVSRADLTITTATFGDIIDVTKEPYAADPTGKIKATTAIQQAINDCPINGTVLIPAEAQLLTGALDLKSNMTLQVEGRLVASLDPADYLITSGDTWFKGEVNPDGLPLSRYEGWELPCYRSLINIGYIQRADRRQPVMENVRICGSGEIYGGGNELGLAMRELYQDTEKYPEYYSDGRPGRRVRGRLICMMQAKNVHLTGVTVANPSSWTIHMIYCDTVTTHGIAIKSRGIDNGDGWDPDSSKNMMIFDTAFDTGDDCIAIKSGKNPEGNVIDIPTENVRIFDLDMLGGHGMAIGSEQSGGVDGVFLRDCRIKNTLYGLELKAHNDRGGYIKNVVMEDCEIDRFMAHSVDYNSDGEPAEQLPVFADIQIINTVINGPGQGIELVGFRKKGTPDLTSDIQRVLMKDVTLGLPTDEEKEIYLKGCRDITLDNVKLANGGAPNYRIDKNTVSNLKIEGND